MLLLDPNVVILTELADLLRSDDLRIDSHTIELLEVFLTVLELDCLRDLPRSRQLTSSILFFPVLHTVSMVLPWQVVGGLLGPADVVLGQQDVPFSEHRKISFNNFAIIHSLFKAIRVLFSKGRMF